MEKKEQGPCPFCPGGGKPYEKDGSSPFTPDFQIVGCEACGCVIHAKNALQIWNRRNFAATPEKQAAYSAMVRLGAAYMQMVAGIAGTISKKRHNILRGAVIGAAAELLHDHAGTIRSALNDVEGQGPAA